MVGLIVAMEAEAEKIRLKLSDAKTEYYNRMRIDTGFIGKTQVVLALSGVGKVAAAFAAGTLINLYSPNILISTGIAGGLGTVETLGVMIPDSFCQHDFDTTALGDAPGFIGGVDKIYFDADLRAVNALRGALKSSYGGVLASGDLFVADTAQCNRIKEVFGACACDLEAAAIAEVAYISNTPFAAIKIISDSAQNNAGITYDELKEIASEINGNTVVSVLEILDTLNK